MWAHNFIGHPVMELLASVARRAALVCERTAERIHRGTLPVGCSNPEGAVDQTADLQHPAEDLDVPAYQRRRVARDIARIDGTEALVRGIVEEVFAEQRHLQRVARLARPRRARRVLAPPVTMRWAARTATAGEAEPELERARRLVGAGTGEGAASIGERLKVLPSFLGKSLRTMAADCGIPYPTYYGYVRGRAVPAPVASAVARATGCRLEWLIDGTGTMFPEQTEVTP